MLNQNKIEQLFRDAEQDSSFQQKGYMIAPFLSEEQVRELRQYFFDTHTEIPDQFYTCSFSEDAEHKKKVNQKIESLFDEQIQELFLPVKKLGACFLNKPPGQETAMPIHQDWTIVDEQHYASVTIWVPLQDVDEENGAIQVIEGSHRFSDAYRSPSLTDPFNNIRDRLEEDLKMLPMKAGQAFVFHHALLHASPPNLSNEHRIAVTYGLIHENAQLLFHHGTDNGQLEQYAVSEDFFHNYNTQIGERPKNGTLINTFEYEQKQITPKEYTRMKMEYHQEKAQHSYKMNPIFKDEANQKTFEEEGYLILPLLNQEEIDDLKSYYESLNLEDGSGRGFHVSMDQLDKEMCKEIREKLWRVIVPKLENYLYNFKPYVASYVIKEPNPKGVVPAHQDWSFVDNEEDGYCSITCWTALTDSNLDNGGMGVIRGSHKFMDNKRPSPSPQTPVPLSEHMFSIFPYLKTLNMKAGDVLFWDNRTFHASPPNTTQQIRLAAGVGVTQKDAQLAHYYLKPDGNQDTLLKYQVDEDFFLKYDNGKLSEMYDNGEYIEGYGEPEEVPYTYPHFKTEELIELIKSAGNEYNEPMTEKLRSIFGDITQEDTEQQDVTEEEQPQQEEENESEDGPQPEESAVEGEQIDGRTFFQKYTPLNIAREIKHRLSKA